MASEHKMYEENRDLRWLGAVAITVIFAASALTLVFGDLWNTLDVLKVWWQKP